MDRRIEWVTAQMQARLGATLTVAGLARDVNLSPSRFAHLFQEQLGTSPARYLRALRMTRARLLLERTFLSIKEVMVHVGCNDPSHFSRDFRRVHGVSPREWRTAAAKRRLQDDASEAIDSGTVSRVAALANDPSKVPSEALRGAGSGGARRAPR
jgi:AraC family transcriptional regulator of arabinose operon